MLDTRDIEPEVPTRDPSFPNLLLTTWSIATPESIMVKSVEALTRSIQLKHLLGAGGFASVFLGVYQASEVAVKLALMPKHADEHKYCREAVLAQQLRHPHVVATYVARGAVMTQDLIDRFHQLDPAAAACGAAGGGGATPRWRMPGALLLPNFPSNRSEDNMGNPRVARQQQPDTEQAPVGWARALHDVGVLPDQILMVMVQELCDSGNLSAALRRGVFVPQPGRTSLRTAWRMLVRTATEVCRGMLHLHTSNVMHGDLKPANVLLVRSRKDQRGFVAKVADFGLSKFLHNDVNHVMSDHVGTVAYSSPEAIQGRHSKTCDVWSFGMLLWELIMQERPFSNLTPAQIMMGVGFDNLRPVWPHAVWPELCAIGERCLAKDPAARPGFAQLEEELVVLEEALRAESRRISGNSAAARARVSQSAAAPAGAAGAAAVSSAVAAPVVATVAAATATGVAAY